MPLLQTECDAQRTPAARSVTIETRCAPARVRGAPDLLRVLARNLIDNGVRYAGEHSCVLVTCDTQEGRVELRVADNGAGIPPEERRRVFERFYRILGNTATGSGLGLSIVQRIAELHAARVDIRDGLDGKGTTFVVTFAAVAEAVSAARRRSSRKLRAPVATPAAMARSPVVEVQRLKMNQSRDLWDLHEHQQ